MTIFQTLIPLLPGTLVELRVRTGIERKVLQQVVARGVKRGWLLHTGARGSYVYHLNEAREAKKRGRKPKLHVDPPPRVSSVWGLGSLV